MSVVSYEVRDGKATYEGKSLAEWVPDVVRLLVERFRPAQVVLFGSVARGDDGRDSDIDLLVVLPELQARHHDAAVAMLRALRDLPVPVDIVVTDQRELQERMATPGVVRVACREGIRSMGEPGAAEAQSRRWLRWADEGLLAGRHNLDDAEVAPRAACGLAHRAAEKAIKALLVVANTDPPKTHDLLRLVRMLSADTAGPFLDLDLEELTRWAIEERYPEDLDEADRKDATRAVELAGQVVAAAQEHVARAAASETPS